MPGTLYVVATPIGNLEDISLRALRVLKSVGIIAAEDTRRTQILLKHYGVSTPCLSFYEHNERVRVPQLVTRLEHGDDVALVSDAGTPGISDPGYQLVRAAHDHHIKVEAIPGPSAVLTALVSSGLPAHEFTFLGFAPARSKDKDRWMARVVAEPRTIVFFDSPRRVRDTLSRLARLAPARDVVVARELTKKFETLVKGPIEQVSERLDSGVRGEITVILDGHKSVESPKNKPDGGLAPTEQVSILGVTTEFDELSQQVGVRRKDIIRSIARKHGLKTRDVYAAVVEAKRNRR